MAIEKLAIDLDSLYTNIYMLGGGVVLSEPTVAAVDQGDKQEVKAIGEDARKLIGKTAKNNIAASISKITTGATAPELNLYPD